MLEPRGCDAGQKPLAMCGSSGPVPICYLNSMINLKKRCVKTFPGKLAVFTVRGSRG